MRETMRALAYPIVMHGAVESCFSHDHGRVLWRVDYLQGKCCLLMVSDDVPVFTQLQGQLGSLDETGQSKPYDPFLERIENGQNWLFRLKANPIRSALHDEKSRGHVYAHVTVEQQRKWLLERCEKHGFAVHEDDFEVKDTRWYGFNHGDSRMVRMKTATFEGSLSVTDADLLRETLVCGIGKEKAYGCGLMTITK